MQQPRFARTRGPADDDEVQLLDQARNIFYQRRSEGFVAAVDDAHIETDFAQNQRQRTTAFAAAPAVGQRFPVARLVHHMLDDVRRYIGRRHRRATFFRLKRVDLLVHGAHFNALGIVQCRPIQRGGQVVFVKLSLGAGVDDGVETV